MKKLCTVFFTLLLLAFASVASANYPYYFYYNMDSDRMCVLDNNGDWRYLDPQGSWAATGVALPAGQMAFELAYGRSFY